ncbi:putative serine/threonine-protein kinase PEPKR2 [Iris pallida]|uniref:Serine/threonine-protein kinase PEPKR2 n=1 Tax=Iris pallida TaxID=29817 RepID=A0AAX6DJ29_IRIPA|nr:putative serine/threonine-protein kinase PEPKR2 [Iris pallida]
MESVRRKRKGTRSSSAVESHLSDNAGDHGRKKKIKKTAKTMGGIMMTAPPSTSSSPESPCRGHKRKIGCVDPSTQIRPEKKLEHEYELGVPIGRGKFGSVRLCRSKSTGEEFACKTLKKNGEESIHREVEIMQHLSGHPNVVALKAVFEDSESFHLVMELCGGGRLLDHMGKEERYSEQKAANLIKELVSVIKYCHEMGVVHRDIKPENILLTVSGKMKLADFGLAVRVANGQRLSGIAGSPAYVAPEVLSGHYSEKVDIWGAGVLLHALLVGVLPFQGDSRDAVFEAIKNVQLDFHSGMWKSISELARDLLSRMLNRDVTTRMTADEILRHPWILFYTQNPSKALPMKIRVRNNVIVHRVGLGEIGTTIDASTSCSLSRTLEEPDDCGFIDALAAAISRVRISEPKRSRLCSPVLPIQQECSSNMKANLCTAF